MHTYLDVQGFADYQDNDQWEIRIERTISASPEELWKAWFPLIWEAPGNIVMVDPGEGPGRSGSKRRVRYAGMTEMILRSGIPTSATKDDEVPSISYTLEHFSVASYLGYVRFFPVEGERSVTRVEWCVKWTPSLAGRVLFLGGHALGWALKSAIRQALTTLDETVARPAP